MTAAACHPRRPGLGKTVVPRGARRGRTRARWVPTSLHQLTPPSPSVSGSLLTYLFPPGLQTKPTTTRLPLALGPAPPKSRHPAIRLSGRAAPLSPGEGAWPCPGEGGVARPSGLFLATRREINRKPKAVKNTTHFPKVTTNKYASPSS